MISRWLVLLVAVVALAATAASGSAATARAPSTHVYATGKVVKNLQWLLAGHRPSHYGIKTYRGRITGRYGRKTVRAVRAMKYRLGWPKSLLSGRVAGRTFFAVLEGKRARPLQWVGIASQRLAAAKRAVDAQSSADAARSTCVRNILTIAGREVGVHEYPDGSNRGARVSTYQSVTGAYGAAWCVSFYQWVITQAGHGPIADRTAGVFYLYHWAQARGWVHSRPIPGAGVSFIHNAGHQGIVTSVTSTGFYTIEGNHDNGVNRAFRRYGVDNPVFIYLPGCS